MATESVATRIAAATMSPESQYEPDAYERILYRIHGLQAINTLASMAVEECSPTEKVMLPFLNFVCVLADDIEMDVNLLRAESRA